MKLAFLFKKIKMENQEVQKVEVLQGELLVIAEQSGVVLTEAQAIGSKFAPFMDNVNTISSQINDLKGQEITPELAKTARKLRLELVSNRGSKGLLATKEELKAGLLTRTRLIDKYVGVVEESSKLSEQAAEAIEKHSERQEEIRLNKIYSDRVLLLEPYGEINKFVDLRSMDDVTFDNFLADTKLAYDTRRENERKAEEARIEAEKKSEQERIEAEKKAEEERLAKEKAEKLERERIEAENEKLRLENEAKEKQLAKEREIQEHKNKRAKELAPFINYIRDYDKLINSSESDYNKELDEMSKAFLLQQKYDADKLEQDRKVQADKDAEIAKLKAEQQAEKQRKEKELEEEKARIDAEEKERLAKEKALKNADDQTKVKAFYDLFKSVEFPELNSEAGKAMSKDINARMADLKKQIILQSKGLL